MHSSSRSSRRKLDRVHLGFSLPELLVVIVILGVIGAVGIQGYFFLVQRARVQSVALEIAGWLEQVRNAAADNVVADNQAGGCVATFSAGDLSVGQQIAIVDADCDVLETTLLVPPGVQQDSVTLNAVDPVIFTPRGLWTDDAGLPGQQFLLTIRLNNALPVRCIRLSPVLGTVEIGRPPNSLDPICDNWRTL